jgi:NIPSNAP
VICRGNRYDFQGTESVQPARELIMKRTEFLLGLTCGLLVALVLSQASLFSAASAADEKKKSDADSEAKSTEGKSTEEDREPMLYELRTYYTPEGKLDELNARFRNHTMALFEKHGMKNIIYWTPVDKPNTLIYVLAHKDKESADASWKAFRDDPEWKKVAEETQRNGKLVEKVDFVYLSPTDYSPHK